MENSRTRKHLITQPNTLTMSDQTDFRSMHQQHKPNSATPLIEQNLQSVSKPKVIMAKILPHGKYKQNSGGIRSINSHRVSPKTLRQTMITDGVKV